MDELHFSLVVLCYRGETAIVPFVESLHAMMSQFNFKWELVLVGNYLKGRPDSTPQVVRELAERLPHVKAVARPKQGMMGWDMKSGLDEARGKYVGVIDGDGQFPMDAVVTCFTKIEQEHLDLVKTYRVRRDDGAYRRLISFVYNALFRVLFDVHIRDANSKPKIMLREKYKLMQLQYDDWFIDAEIMIRAKELGLKFSEIPVHFVVNAHRPSFVKPQAILEFALNLIRFRFFRKTT